MHLAWCGWPLAAAPASPLAAHILEIIATLLPDGRVGRVSLIQPTGEAVDLPASVERLVLKASPTSWGRLLFEQRSLPRAAKRAGCDAVIYPYATAPLVSPLPVAVLLGGAEYASEAGPLERLRRSLGRAGLGGAMNLVLDDLPARISADAGGIRLKPFVGDGFRPTEDADAQVRQRYELEAGYVLCYGLEAVDVPLLLAAWTWVDASLGDAYPLVFAGLEASQARPARGRARSLGVSESVRFIDSIKLADLPAVYRGAQAFLHPGHTRSGQELRWALATGVPVAAAETAFTDSILQQAGYLTPVGDSRALGAACLTLLVEREQVAEPLRQKGLLRAAAYHGGEPVNQWLEVLQALVAGNHAG